MPASDTGKHPPYPLSYSFISNRLAFKVFYPLDKVASDGRPILEGRSFLHKLPSSSFRKSMYPGIRRDSDMVMNVGALQSLLKVLPKTKQLIDGYKYTLNLTGNYTDNKPSWLWRIAYLGWTHPLFGSLVLFDEVTDSDVANISKLCHGVLTLLEPASEIQRQIYDPAHLYETAESTKKLLGFRETCAAPRKLIEDILELMLSDVKQCNIIDARWLGLAEFSSIRWCLEHTAMAYEWFRCTYLIHKKTSVIDQRYAFPYARKIFNSCLNGEIYQKSYVGRYNYKCFSYTLSKRFEIEFLSFTTFLETALQDPSLQYDREWIQELSMLTLNVLNACEQSISRLSSSSDQPYQYKQDDLLKFFGSIDEHRPSL